MIVAQDVTVTGFMFKFLLLSSIRNILFIVFLLTAVAPYISLYELMFSGLFWEETICLFIPFGSANIYRKLREIEGKFQRNRECWRHKHKIGRNIGRCRSRLVLQSSFFLRRILLAIKSITYAPILSKMHGCQWLQVQFQCLTLHQKGVLVTKSRNEPIVENFNWFY